MVNEHKPSKPKDLGWDYQKDKEAKRVSERKKEVQRLREKEEKENQGYVLSVGTPNTQENALVRCVDKKDIN